MKHKKKSNASEELMKSIMDQVRSDAAESTALLQESSSETQDEDLLDLGIDDSALSEELEELKGSRSVATDETLSRTLHPADAVDEPVFISPEPKVIYGIARSESSSPVGSSLHQAENLKLAQQRILELEKHMEKLRQENEQFSSASENAKDRNEELQQKVRQLEKSKAELQEQSSIDVSLLKDNLHSREYEVSKLKNKVRDLESRLASDLKKIRVRERELENRLELSKVEKNALLKSKDETILDLKRKMDVVSAEVESYQQKCIELSQKIESNQEQFARTVRALRLALTNLEVSENTSTLSVAPFKKAD